MVKGRANRRRNRPREGTVASVASFNEGWAFACLTEAGRPNGRGDGERVTLPHTAVELPYDYFDETAYQRRFS